MAEDNSSHDRIEQLNKRLDYLESISRETIARLYSIETHLGIARRMGDSSAARKPESDRPESDRQSITRSNTDAAIKANPIEPSALPPQTRQPQPEATSIPLPNITETPPPERIAPPSTPAPLPRVTQASDGPRDTAPGDVAQRDTAQRSLPSDRRVLGVPVPQGPPPAQTSAHQANDTRQARQSAPTLAQARSKSRGDLEALIGGNWFNRIGIIAIAIGVAFFLKYAFDNDWIGPWGQVLTSVAIGMGFLIAGERLRPRYQNYAYGLSGGGVLILYLSIYAAHAFFSEPLIGQFPAFIYMAIVTATASLLSARYNALPIAFLGLIGGFLTPILLSTGVDNQVGLFTYIALLDVGVLGLAYSKQWRSLNYAAFIATVLMFAGWMLEWYAPEKLWTTIFFMTLFFIIFSMLAVLYNVVNRRPTMWIDLLLVFANGLLYFSSSYLLLEERYRGALGLFAVLVSAFYLALSYFTYNRDREDRLLVYTFLGLGFLFAVLAVPIQFNQHWVTMGWAIEGAVMTWVGMRANDRTSRYAALVIFGIAVTHWVLVDVHDFAYQASETFVPLLNRRALSCAALVAALAASAILYKRNSAEIDEEERSMFTGLYLLGANILAVTLLSLDANDYFTQLKELAHEQAGGQDNFRMTDQWRQINNTHQLTLSALWSIYGATALIVGLMRRLKPLRVAAGVLLAITTIKVLAVDLNYYNASWHTAVFNQTFAAFALLILAMSASAWFYAKAKGVDAEERAMVLPLLIGAANVLAVLAMSVEVIGHFERMENAVGGQPSETAYLDSTKQLILSAVWILYATIAFMIGVKRRLKLLRAGALVLLALATIKVLFEDLSYYNAQSHMLIFNQTFAAFALLISAFVVIAWLYARSEELEKSERDLVMPLIIGAANLLALIALSAEAVGYFDRAQAIARIGEGVRGEVASLENSKQFALSAIWTVYAAIALCLGIARNSRLLRWGAISLLTLATLKVLVVDLKYYAAGHTVIFNQTFAAFALLILAISVGVRFYSRAEAIDEQERTSIIPLMVAVANLLAIIAFSAEAYGYYVQKLEAPGASVAYLRNQRLAQQLSLSVIWTVYGGAMLAAGIVRRNRMLRMMALGLLGLTIVKVFLIDLSSLERVYRIVSFIVLGAILLAVSFLYQRYRQRMADLIDEPGADAPADDAPMNEAPMN
jgi:uncharacterized membrane protein